MYQTIPATEETPNPLPPMSGSWVRLESGALQPADDATATAAGLQPDPEPEPE